MGIAYLRRLTPYRRTTIQWIGKLICYGETREVAIARMKNALAELIIDGIKTNIELQTKIMNDENFQHGGTNIHYLEKKTRSSALSFR
ncbi:Biotin carboxylase [Cedecea neteri]|uniref:biotin carboxylase n=1 Tax=Cedecea neteri TaxID=158822 RepID=A0A2X2TAV5_9ENTR|nr:Biotin carboxylase [Cedecea neteri]